MIHSVEGDNMYRKKEFWRQVGQKSLQNIWLYTKSQAKLIGLSFILYTIGFYLLDFGWWSIALGLLVSFLGIVPVIGAGLIFIPWILYEWIIVTPGIGWWLLALYIGIELLEQIIEPLFVGSSIDLPFWLTAIILVSFPIIFNVFGIVLSAIAIPVLSAFLTVRNQYKTHQLNL